VIWNPFVYRLARELQRFANAYSLDEKVEANAKLARDPFQVFRKTIRPDIVQLPECAKPARMGLPDLKVWKYSAVSIQPCWSQCFR
jgi:hypothetical protein